MKRILLSSTALLIVVLTSLTGCDGGQGSQEVSQEAISRDKLTTKITVTSSQDLIDVCDIAFSYKGVGGVTVTDTITTTNWEKTIVNDKFPTQIGVVTQRYLIKPGFKVSDKTYDLVCEFKVVSPGYSTGGYFLGVLDVPSHKVQSFMDLFNFSFPTVEQVEDGTRSSATIVTVKQNDDTTSEWPFDYWLKPYSSKDSINVTQKQ